MRNELIYDMPAKEYHSIEALSASGAKLLLKSPAHYYASRSEFKAPSAAMKLGTAVHTAILEPELFDAEIAIEPKLDKRTKIGKEAAEQFSNSSEGKTIIDFYQGERCRAITEAVRAHPYFQKRVTGGKAEATMLWKQYNVQCKARIDYLVERTMFDVKTCQDASPEGFSKQIANFQYHIQAAHYAMGFKRLTGTPLEQFVFIAVESEMPHMVGIYALSADSLRAGAFAMKKAADNYDLFLSQKIAKSYNADAEEISIPSWAMPEPFGA
ncbi:Putative exodeoxyribonuclease 8, PDDEXK-like domain containing protein [uncultured Caudovirales phage]|uniref:Exodeoxyribonuclease 8, PDDEXK-like domain containing protein n=1 Tax=uncultured Caudovirales phage TaxID=2100421 RepID=A0A6J7WC59_9CAUD|nr:Putative exodeoxyribonuclease 8, PDDEXK-like domain containing protein [uncultured Caudovirales phage]